MCHVFSFVLLLLWFQTKVGGDYYTGEYDYTTVDGSQPETPTDTAEQGQVTSQLLLLLGELSNTFKCV